MDMGRRRAEPRLTHSENEHNHVLEGISDVCCVGQLLTNITIKVIKYTCNRKQQCIHVNQLTLSYTRLHPLHLHRITIQMSLQTKGARKT